jgi:hypothetical protein
LAGLHLICVTFDVLGVDMAGSDATLMGSLGIYNRLIFWILVFLPALTIAFMIATDVWSLFRPALVRNPNKLLYELLSFSELIEVAAIELIAMFILGRILSTCNDILRCEKATEEVLQQFHNLLFGDVGD